MNARRSINGPLPARPARTSAEASGAAVSSGGALMKHGGLLAGRNRPARDQQPRRRVPVHVTEAAVTGLARPGRSETSCSTCSPASRNCCGGGLARGLKVSGAVGGPPPRAKAGRGGRSSLPRAPSGLFYPEYGSAIASFESVSSARPSTLRLVGAAVSASVVSRAVPSAPPSPAAAEVRPRACRTA